MPKISIIVPIYNVEKYLDKCINSILNQTFEDFELILVDDGSPDKCGEMCDEYKKIDKRIKVIHKINVGLSSARNAGIDIATGEYIGFIDSDDWISNKMYEYLYKMIVENDVDISQCRFIKKYDDVSSLEEDSNTNDTINIMNSKQALYELTTYDNDKNVQAVVVWNKLYKRKLFENIRYPVGKIHEDEFTTFKLLDKSNKIATTDRELYYYRQSPNSIVNSPFNPKRLDYLLALEEQLDYFKNHSDEIYNRVIKRYYRSLLVNYSNVKKFLNNNEQLLQMINKKSRKRLVEFLKCNGLGIKHKINIFIFAINPALYRLTRSILNQ